MRRYCFFLTERRKAIKEIKFELLFGENSFQETLQFEGNATIRQAEGYLLQKIKERSGYNLNFLHFIYYIPGTGFLMNPDDDLKLLKEESTIRMIALDFYES